MGFFLIFPGRLCTGTSQERYCSECSTNSTGIDDFFDLAISLEPTTDKVTLHSFDLMYGMFLGPIRDKRVKMLEIGMGCDSKYGPGASVKVWKRFLNDLELWEADCDGTCVRSHLDDGMLDGIFTLVGDQGDSETLDGWIRQSASSGPFNVIVDDGGHKNNQIFTSFHKLWPTLGRGGLYFIEDMQVCRSPHYEDSLGQNIMVEVIQDWTEQLLISSRFQKKENTRFLKILPLSFANLKLAYSVRA